VRHKSMWLLVPLVIFGPTILARARAGAASRLAGGLNAVLWMLIAVPGSLVG
jgi:hypothetical protein